MSDPGALLAALGEPRRAGVNKPHHAPDLTVLNLVWAPMMTVMPRNHRMWAVIGICTGREDNIFWRRVGAEDGRGGGRVEAAGARALSARDCAVLGRDVTHSATNRIPRPTGALHVHGGDFFNGEKSEWDPETLGEKPYDVAKTIRMSGESNAALAAADR